MRGVQHSEEVVRGVQHSDEVGERRGPRISFVQHSEEVVRGVGRGGG